MRRAEAAGLRTTLSCLDKLVGHIRWLHELRFDRTDRIALVAFATLLVGATIAAWTTSSAQLWVPPFMTPG